MWSKVSPQSDWTPGEAVDVRRIALMRLLLVAAALVIVIIDPSQPARFALLTYAVLIAYVGYAASLCILTARTQTIAPLLRHWSHWVDVAWFTLLVELSNGADSVFFFGYFFAILVASFRKGFRTGLLVALVSTASFTVVVLILAASPQALALNRVLLRPVYLLLLGYMLAYWGEREITLKRRLTLLGDASVLSNPRFGVDQTMRSLMERLRAFYMARSCILVSVMLPTVGPPITEIRRIGPRNTGEAEAAPPEIARRLLALPDEVALVYHGRPQGLRRPRLHAIDIRTGRPTPASLAEAGTLATLIEGVSYLTLPIRYHQEGTGRLYLVADRPNAFDDSDVAFLLQVLHVVTPVLENIRLVDRLASEAAEEERQRIARDLHDGVIQTYIGLQMGLSGIRTRAATGADVTADLDRLGALAAEGVETLRGYLGGLRGTHLPAGTLPAALRRFASRFSLATGIEVTVEADGNLRVNDRLAAEILQMAAEGLSNIRRHSDAPAARLSLARRGDQLVLSVEAEGTGGPPPPPFRPRSLSEGAAALGGHVLVMPRSDGGSAVIVEIPV